MTRSRVRGNGEGCAYKRGKTWEAQVCFYDRGVRKRKRKSGFRTKSEALLYLPALREEALRQAECGVIPTAQEVFDRVIAQSTAGESRKAALRAAWTHCEAVAGIPFNEIRLDDWQSCADGCPGRSMKQVVKDTISQMYKYALPRHWTNDNLNLAQFVKLPIAPKPEKRGFTQEELDILWQHQDDPFISIVLIGCYTGFRPGELTRITKESYDAKNRTITGGSKTEAGKNRLVPLAPRIQPLFLRWWDSVDSGYIFLRKGKPWTRDSFARKFHAEMKRIGVDNSLTPHCTRHTFATMIKNVAAADRDKMAVIGHASGEMLRYYQDVNLDDLRKVTDSL